MSNHHPEMLDPRQAGNGRRYHTWAYNREQSVAEHSWNVARLLLAWDPTVSRKLLVHALMHDIGERICGDLPYPVKANNPLLKREMDRLEHDGQLAMCYPWGVPAPVVLSAEELEIFKLADLCDMWEWALDELARGNKHARLVYERTDTALCERLLSGTLDKSIKLRAELYIQRRIRHEGRYHGE